MATTTKGQLTINSGGVNYIATPNKNTTAAQTAAAQSAGWKPVSSGSSYTPTGATIQGGQALPTQNKPVDTTIVADQIGKVPVSPVIPTVQATDVPKSLAAPLVAPMTTVDTATNDSAIATQAQKRIDQLLGTQPEAPNATDIYNQVQQQEGIRQKESSVQNYTAQINAINNNAQAAILQTQGQGRGIPEYIIGGQQAQISKEAAIQTLPLQALLSAAQGDLDSARSHADTLFNLYYKDATAKSDQWWKTADLYMNEFSEIEQQQINEKKSEQDFQRTLYRDKMDNVATLAKGIMDTNPAYAAQLMQLTPPIFGDAQSQAEYDREVNRIMAKIPTGGSGETQLYAGLSAPTATAVRSVVSKFGSDPTVTNFTTIQDGYNFASSLDTKTKNPADDQALIYSLAKALDPGSVVREGEYATAQKYSQSWINAYGKGITQALAGTGFLSETARANIKKTIEQKYLSTKKTYDNSYNQYVGQINNLTGRDDGQQFLRDYAIPGTTTTEITPEVDSIMKDILGGASATSNTSSAPITNTNKYLTPQEQSDILYGTPINSPLFNLFK